LKGKNGTSNSRGSNRTHATREAAEPHRLAKAKAHNGKTGAVERVKQMQKGVWCKPKKGQQRVKANELVQTNLYRATMSNCVQCECGYTFKAFCAAATYFDHLFTRTHLKNLETKGNAKETEVRRHTAHHPTKPSKIIRNQTKPQSQPNNFTIVAVLVQWLRFLHSPKGADALSNP
jgi:hypothetical protein